MSDVISDPCSVCPLYETILCEDCAPDYPLYADLDVEE